MFSRQLLAKGLKPAVRLRTRAFATVSGSEGRVVAPQNPNHQATGKGAKPVLHDRATFTIRVSLSYLMHDGG